VTNAPRRRNAPRLPPEARREQFLDSALRVVSVAGFAGLSMESVAREARVAKPVLYALYPTRVALVSALLEREYAEGLDELLAAMPSGLLGKDPDVAYVETVRAFLTAIRSHPDRWKLILQPGDDAPVEFRGYVAAARRGIVKNAIALAESGLLLRGGPTHLDPELFGHAMFAIAELLGRLHLTEPERFDDERLVAFAAGLCAALPRTTPTSSLDGAS